MKRSVTGRRDNANSLHDLLLANHELELVRAYDRHVVALEIACGGALIGMHRVIVFAFLHHIARLWKRDLDFACGIRPRIPASVVEMQMRIDHGPHVRRRYSDLMQSVFEAGAAVGPLVLDAVNVLELLGLLVPRSRVDENRAERMLDQQAPHSELNPVAFVGRNPALPQRLRNHSEHCATVQPLAACLNRVNGEVTDFSSFNQRCRIHAVVSLVTGEGHALRRFFLRDARCRISFSRSSQVVHPRSARLVEQAQQAAGRGDRVARSAMPAGDLYSIVVRDIVERPPRKMRQQPARETNGAQLVAGDARAGRSLYLVREEAPVELRIVRNEDISLELLEKRRHDPPRMSARPSPCPTRCW